MTHRIAKIISTLLSPMLMPTLLFGIIYFFCPVIISPLNSLYFLGLVFMYTYIVPGIGLLVMYKLGTIKSLNLDDRNQPVIPYVFISFFYVAITYMFVDQFKVSTAIGVVMAAITFTFLLVTVLNYFWKISGHSACITAVLGFIVGINYKQDVPGLLYPILCLIVLSGLLMTCRLYLNLHNPRQVLAGSIAGFVISLFIVVFFL